MADKESSSVPSTPKKPTEAPKRNNTGSLLFKAVPPVLLGVGAVYSRNCETWSEALGGLLTPLLSLGSTVVGTTIGVALGLGLASHVYDKLTYWNELQQPPVMPPRSATKMSRTLSSPHKSAAAVLQDEQTYPSLLQSAGYKPHATLLRGQVLKRPAEPNYRFNGNDKAPRHASAQMNELWPTLPAPVRDILAQFVEYIVRDFVASWFGSVDTGVVYRDARDKSELPPDPTPRVLTSTAMYRQAPFIDHLYESMAIIFGNLAIRVEHVNVLKLALLQWTRILAHTFRWYRHLRKTVQAKGIGITEMALTREFLVANKLHRAVTFGLDVPALLFADASGKECGETGTPDEILERRLLACLPGCELDYHRVVAHRMVRALVPRHDFGSGIVASFLTEVLAGSALTPMMACFGPDYLNSWIVQGLKKEEGATEEANDELLGTRQPSENGETDVAAAVEEAMQDDTLDELHPFTEEETPPSSENVVGDHSEATVDTAPEILATTSAEDSINSLLALALIDVQKYVDFEDSREARDRNERASIDWDDPGCRAVVLRLVLVIELALTHGRCTYRDQPKESGDVENGSVADLSQEEDDEMEDSDRPVEVTLPDYESTTLSQILMEMTSNIEVFEEKVAKENTLAAEKNHNMYEDMIVEEYKPTAQEQSTLRTLITAWMHTGSLFQTITVLVQAHTTVLAPYYHDSAFLRSRASARGFVRQLKALDGVDIMADTMTVLASPRLDETDDEGLKELVRKSAMPSPVRQKETNISAAQLVMSSSSTPRYLDFHRNESFAASLRSERERRMQSWRSTVLDDEDVAFISRTRGASQGEMAVHRELHHIARVFYSGTNMIGIRDAARRKRSVAGEEGSVAESTIASEDGRMSLITVETTAGRRRIEVPDDDSSFLPLRAQPRNLNAVGVHRDQRNHDQSFKSFAATFYEPVFRNGASNGQNGRYIRRCLIKYYPIDRTALVTVQNDSRRLDQRKSRVPQTITLDDSARSTPYLSSDFLRERHLCQRFVPKGTARTQSILASSVMEPTDFTSMPRPGKAIDYVYKMSFFEEPMLDLAGNRFTVHDSSSLGVHRADASAIELSDASLSYALMSIQNSDTSSESHRAVEMGKDGYPTIWMKFSRKNEDTPEVRPYRLSFIRAALMVAASRHEAQLQCIVACIKSGSAKKATKQLTDLYLKPSLKLIEYAGHRSREKQSLLLRDLKLGVSHVDKAQLQRNGLLSPRYPTQIEEFTATVEDSIQTSFDRGGDIFGVTTTAYKVRCVATVRIVAREDELTNDPSYIMHNGIVGRTFREEWVIYRTFKEFQGLHKHLKSQVSSSMSSGTAGSRLVGAATAAFTAGSPQFRNRNRHKQPLVPSLSQASKAGALGVTKKSIQKRQEILNTYISYIFTPGHPLNFSSEVLLFFGGYYPLAPDVTISHAVSSLTDPLGRTEMQREVIDIVEPSAVDPKSTANGDMEVDELDETEDDTTADKAQEKSINMIPSIRSKVDKVPLSQVRNRFFELLRYQFGFENASFIRNRMLAALKTASFAVTSAAEFRRMLYNAHTSYLSAEAVASYIKMGVDLLWPDGAFFEAAPPYTQEQLDETAAEARQVLHTSFPEQVRSILGPELTQDGLDVFHEMLQNRLVMKSMFYMMFDLLWVEVFPEIGDVLQGGSAIDVDNY